jgi:Ni,Fe-hydrogenase III large subunit
VSEASQAAASPSASAPAAPSPSSTTSVTTSVLVHREELRLLPLLEIAAWRSQLLARERAGARVLTLYGRRDGERVVLTAALLHEDRIEVLRTSVNPAGGYHELTSEIPALHCFEREVHEQYGVRVAGHPWLKPVRFEGQDQDAMKAYPFYRVDGKEVHEVAVGPIHAGVIEPGAFRFMCFGEHVLHLEIHLGYQHRGVERRLLLGDPRRLTPVAETIAGDTSVAHAWAYCAALERLAAADVSVETEQARAVVLELERVAMHLAGLSGLAADVGFLPGASTYGRLRTTAINTTMRLCGSRFGRGALRPAQQPMQLDAELGALVRKNLLLLRTDLDLINDCFLSARTVRHRLAGVGTVTPETARQLGLVGMAARASGVPIDTRAPVRGAFAAPALEVCVEPAGDCLARARLRIDELGASLRWLEATFAAAPRWVAATAATAATASAPAGLALAPCQLAIAVVEGWRGEVVHCLETDDHGNLLHYKVQDPSLRNWMGLALAVRGNEISDFPICNKSFDLSYCGNDL